MKYTLCDLLKDLEEFSLDAEVVPAMVDDEEVLFEIHNPVPVDGHKEWYITTWKMDEEVN